jgi:hypothetical protein
MSSHRLAHRHLLLQIFLAFEKEEYVFYRVQLPVPFSDGFYVHKNQRGQVVGILVFLFSFFLFYFQVLMTFMVYSNFLGGDV